MLMCLWYFLVHYELICLLTWALLIVKLVSMQAAIISLGLIGAGTNNARIAGMLRNLSSYYYKEAGHLFCVSMLFAYIYFCLPVDCNLKVAFKNSSRITWHMQVRIAQGLVHLGKGLLTLSPYHSDRFLLSPWVLFSLQPPSSIRCHCDLNAWTLFLIF